MKIIKIEMRLRMVGLLKNALPPNCTLTSFNGATHFEIGGDFEEEKVREIIAEMEEIKVIQSLA